MKQLISFTGSFAAILAVVAGLMYLTSVDVVTALVIFGSCVASMVFTTKAYGFKGHFKAVVNVWENQSRWVRIINWPVVTLMLVIFASADMWISFWVLLILNAYTYTVLELGKSDLETN